MGMEKESRPVICGDAALVRETQSKLGVIPKHPFYTVLSIE